MALGKDYPDQDCSLARALELLGERWTMLIVRDAFYGVRRYNDFLVHLDVPRAVLAERLTALTNAGVLARHRYQEAPPRDEYVLTEMGLGLWPTLHSLARWGDRHLGSEKGPKRLFVHVGCDTRLDALAQCPTCGQVDPAEVEMRPGPGADPFRTDRVSVALRQPHRMLEPVLA
ncbi:winged helix-turn-helix transcriptional regulator [Tenggerimyces flavus]|uniref:Winged helix-turn-helix transcriptional regulator n=1 Tax=Tenggerimyces flavus TaxID=1708749 RepID=A0ABV7YDQ5_9ACTN|nr:helix-turn-helix domain-containing protein [Tenggerimyces flavus]MBM7791366.1 DNA-binding HxlR family transcriptional regulator [Tenggerimyces flavus]